MLVNAPVNILTATAKTGNRASVHIFCYWNLFSCTCCRMQCHAMFNWKKMVEMYWNLLQCSDPFSDACSAFNSPASCYLDEAAAFQMSVPHLAQGGATRCAVITQVSWLVLVWKLDFNVNIFRSSISVNRPSSNHKNYVCDDSTLIAQLSGGVFVKAPQAFLSPMHEKRSKASGGSGWERRCPGSQNGNFQEWNGLSGPPRVPPDFGEVLHESVPSLSLSLPISPSLHRFIISIYLSICLSVCLSVRSGPVRSVRPVRPSLCLSAYLSIYLASYLI